MVVRLLTQQTVKSLFLPLSSLTVSTPSVAASTALSSSASSTTPLFDTVTSSADSTCLGLV
ncbi:hypothetical protein PtA15_7A436 [Puccinia triticina]|uniref:Secreted protein n=1 Tax=Puccinia triticina TaxID=208348 RepID=A0ABY7CNA5_9BASI|nr:uncharacterized protein PtA15_7A436 [Puccinia triticina]WAQ86708.1 hypothetical protein PtA15_7A436 [Puccinia triticina]